MDMVIYMKVKDIIKKQTTLIAIAVVVVVVAAISVSYAIFFDVKAGDTQVITAGSLKLTLTDITALSITEPKTDSDGLKSSPVNYTIKNTDSNLPASYSIYIYADDNNTVDLSKIKISTDGDASSGTTAKTIASITPTLQENGKTYFLIKSDTIAANATATNNYIRVWVDEDALTQDIEGARVDLSLYVVSEVQE